MAYQFSEAQLSDYLDKCRAVWSESAAMIIEAECERVLALQKPDGDPLGMMDTVNMNLRMTTVLLPDLAAKIRAIGSHASAHREEKS